MAVTMPDDQPVSTYQRSACLSHAQDSPKLVWTAICAPLGGSTSNPMRGLMHLNASKPQAFQQPLQQLIQQVGKQLTRCVASEQHTTAMSMLQWPKLRATPSTLVPSPHQPLSCPVPKAAH
ncbi:hypothetical protein ABBQ38_005869 [Trebouxia sp. C0009 RCD-2024]